MRRLLLNTFKNNHGFSLLEMAAVLVVAGLIITPAISLYHQHQVEEDWEQTEENIEEVALAIGGFRSVYGRYPCPASSQAVPGDAEYGHEADCTATPAGGACIDGICAADSNVSGRKVLIGSIPFKILNLPEIQAYDKYQSRLTYAVTENLTNPNTFDITGGGISIEDEFGNSIVTPADTAHFIVISHGQNIGGGITKAGLEKVECNDTTIIEQENCDNNATFISADVDDDYDDRTVYFSAVDLSEWQQSELAGFENSIHLKSTDSIAVGASSATDMSSADQTTVLQLGADSGGVRANANFKLQEICEYGASSSGDCFDPSLIGGNVSDGKGIQCPPDQFLTAIQSKTPICTDEVYQSCSNNKYIIGIQADGSVVCGDTPPAPCTENPVTTFCGDNRIIGEGEVVSSGSFRELYSGTCHMITDYNSTYFQTSTSGMSYSIMRFFINNLNAQGRTTVDCEEAPNKALVRDSYRCESGTWKHKTSHELLGFGTNFPTSKTSYPGSSKAENTQPNTSDPNNNNGYHDCWCREDYRVSPASCPNGQSGTAYRIQKHNCPQTSHTWQTVYTNEESCACVPIPQTVTKSCNAYYNEVNSTTGTSGLSGTVYITYDTSCVDDVLVRDPTPSSIDTSDCACKANPQMIRREYCPTGTGNSWSWAGGNEDDVEDLYTRDWVCPATTSGGLPDPGYYAPETALPGVPACTCEEYDEIYTDSCPAGETGTGIKRKRTWSCALGNWDPVIEEISNDCHKCSWQTPPGAPSLENYPYGKSKGGTCSCGEAPAAQCNEPSGNNKYKVWSGCQCVGQND